MATVIDDFNGDNFDHTGLGFIGGGYIAGMVTGGRPIEMIYTPEGTPKWGVEVEEGGGRQLPEELFNKLPRLDDVASRQLPGP